MVPGSKKAEGARERTWAIRGALLAGVLAVSLWGAAYFGVEARVRRGTARVVRLAEKKEAESPVSLGLAVNRFGKCLAADAVLELEGYGALATGRREIVQLFAQIRESLAQIEFADPVLAVGGVLDGKGEVRVTVRYRLAPAAGDAAEGEGSADLTWIRGEEGWQISRAALHPGPGARLPGGWK